MKRINLVPDNGINPHTWKPMIQDQSWPLWPRMSFTIYKPILSIDGDRFLSYQKNLKNGKKRKKKRQKERNLEISKFVPL